MRVSVSEARRRLPSLLKRVTQDPTLRIEITVHDEPVAELRAVAARAAPGAAARRLLALARALSAEAGVPTGQREDVAGHVEEHLYGPDGVIR